MCLIFSKSICVVLITNLWIGVSKRLTKRIKWKLLTNDDDLELDHRYYIFMHLLRDWLRLLNMQGKVIRNVYKNKFLVFNFFFSSNMQLIKCQLINYFEQDQVSAIKSFYATGFFLYPLKTWETQMKLQVFDVFRGYRKGGIKPAGIYMFKINNRNTIVRNRNSIVNFEQVNAGWEKG